MAGHKVNTTSGAILRKLREFTARASACPRHNETRLYRRDIAIMADLLSSLIDLADHESGTGAEDVTTVWQVANDLLRKENVHLWRELEQVSTVFFRVLLCLLFSLFIRYPKEGKSTNVCRLGRAGLPLHSPPRPPRRACSQATVLFNASAGQARSSVSLDRETRKAFRYLLGTRMRAN